MKTSILLFTLLTIAQGMAFAQFSFDNDHETLESQLTNGLKQNEANALMSLFPTLEELYALMDANASFYSTTLNDAKAALLIDYEKNILPRARLAFQQLLIQGKEKGIDWRAIESIEIMRSSQPVSPGSVCLRFHANGTTFNVEAKLFTNVQGRLKLTQFIKFI
jgi:hypothetical protein